MIEQEMLHLPAGEVEDSWFEQSMRHALSHKLTEEIGLRRVGNEMFWDTQEQDYEIWMQVLERIIGSTHMDDEEYVREIIPQIELLLCQSPLFSLLKNQAQVNHAHNGISPFDHSLNVAREGKTGPHLSKLTIILKRFMDLFHDIGKNWGAAGDEARFHSYLTVIFLWRFLYENLEYLKQDEIGEIELQKMLYVLQFHHVFWEIAFWEQDAESSFFNEKIKKRKGKERQRLLERREEIKGRFVFDDVAILFLLLSYADVKSIPGYNGKLRENTERFFKLKPEMKDEVKALGMYTDRSLLLKIRDIITVWTGKLTRKNYLKIQSLFKHLKILKSSLILQNRLLKRD